MLIAVGAKNESKEKKNYELNIVHFLVQIPFPIVILPFYLEIPNYTLPSALGAVPRRYGSSPTNSRGTRHLNSLHGRSADNSVIYEAVLRHISSRTRDPSEVN